MITLNEILDFPETYPLTRIGKREDLLFFDIETTGFSAEFSTVYLIGCTYFKDHSWHLTQWFAESLEAEKDVLDAFFEFLSHYTTVVHFNGDGFDIPYLTKRCQQLHLPYDFTGVSSFDIYKKVRPYRNLLGLASMKQKAIEEFLHVKRTDMYSGGQLIEVYQDYLSSREDFLFRMLILHNADDLKGMPSILPILFYPDFLNGTFELKHQELCSRKDVFGHPYPYLTVVCDTADGVPEPFSRSNSMVTLEALGSRMTLSIDLYEGELKYFYNDYKNYYYLIYEDNAIHKSVAEYVDKSARIKATAKTCYCRKPGLYLPQFEPLWEPSLKQEYKSKISYVPYCEDLFSQEADLNRYISHLFRIL